MKLQRILAILLALLMLMVAVGCDTSDDGPAAESNDASSQNGNQPNKNNSNDTALLSFSQAQSIEVMQSYDGRQVTIIGYMSTLSPLNGSFMYLMNLPYQSCPFCVPNTTQLANTMAVYAKKGKAFEFTDRAIQVTGILEFGEFSDEFGYTYNYRIKDATYTELDTANMDEKLKLWQQLATTDVIAEIYQMYEYVNFCALWPTYTSEFQSGRDYLYPSDAAYFLKTDGAQFHYGYKEGYFDGIVRTIEEVDAEKFADLVANVRKAEALAKTALSALEAEEYAAVSEYSDTFKDGRSQYKLNDQDSYQQQMEEIYREFSTWLSGWEL